MTESQARQLEIDSRLPVDQAWHPDSCDSLTIAGVSWSVRPLKSPGTVSPVFDCGAIDVGMTLPDEHDPIAEMAQAVLDAAEIQAGDICPTCGRTMNSDLQVDMDGQSAFLRSAFQYVSALLRQQYHLEDADLASLLSFPADKLPEWIPQLVSHAHGLTVNG